MSTLDAFLEPKQCRSDLVAEQKRRKAEIEARRPAEVPHEMLMMEESEFIASYRKAYGVNPRGIEINQWYRAERQRERHKERGLVR
jgi:hypothetical protein